MGTIVISILAFLIPGLVCYWYSQWREKNRNERVIKEQISIKCPECKSTNIVRTDCYNIDDGLIGNRLFEEYKCQDCGKIFSVPV